MIEDGDVYAWGRGDSGQLGFGTEFDYSTPRVVDGLIDYTVVEIASGTDFCIARTDTGDIYVWGNNSNGQVVLICISN